MNAIGSAEGSLPTVKIAGDGSVSTALRAAFNHEETSDLKVIVRGTTFHVHRLIVILQSKMFAAMLRGGWQEAEKGEVIIDEYPAEHVKPVLEWMYAGTTKVTASTVLGVLRVADYMQLDEFAKKCSELAVQFITNDDMLNLLQAALEHNERTVTTACLAHWSTHAASIISSPAFYRTNVDTLKALVACSTIHCSEDVLFARVMRWFRQHEFINDSFVSPAYCDPGGDIARERVLSPAKKAGNSEAVNRERAAVLRSVLGCVRLGQLSTTVLFAAKPVMNGLAGLKDEFTTAVMYKLSPDEVLRTDAGYAQLGPRVSAIENPVPQQHPAVADFLRSVGEVRFINLRSLAEPDMIEHVVPMQAQWRFPWIIDAIANAVGADANYVRFYVSCNPTTPKAWAYPQRSDGSKGRTLDSMTPPRDCSPNDIWYEVLSVTRAEAEEAVQLTVSLTNEVGEIQDDAHRNMKVELPISATGRDVVFAVLARPQAPRPVECQHALLVMLSGVIRRIHGVNLDDDESVIRYVGWCAPVPLSLQVMPFTPPSADEIQYPVCFGQWGTPVVITGTPFLVNLPKTATPEYALNRLLEMCRLSHSVLGKYKLMMHTTGDLYSTNGVSLYFADFEKPLVRYWAETPASRMASLMLERESLA
jgi:hypothetical protein